MIGNGKTLSPAYDEKQEERKMEDLIWEATYMTLAALMTKNSVSNGGRKDGQDKGK